MADAHTRLDRLVAEAHSVWPPRWVAEPELRAHLEASLERAGTETLHAADLYLALACARGCTEAIRAFEDRATRELDRALRPFRIQPALAADVMQEVRRRLLVGPGRPKLLDYAGRGPLAAWLKTVAMRTAIDLLPRTDREVPVEDRLLRAMPTQADDPELEHVRRRYGDDFKAAFEEALASLDAKQQLLLRRYYVDQLDTPALASLYRVHVVTVVRWLGRLRQLLERRTRDALGRRIAGSPSELRSIVRLVKSEVDVSIARILRHGTTKSPRTS